MLGLYTSGGPNGSEIDIFETGFSAPTDGANLLQILGTPSGRIFMAGADGFLYELSYGTTRGWLDTYRTCAKRNRSRKTQVALQFVTSAVYDSSDPILDMAYDAERGILYTLSRASTIQMYDLGADGEGFKFVESKAVADVEMRLSSGEGLIGRGSGGAASHALTCIIGRLPAAPKTEAASTWRNASGTRTSSGKQPIV